MTTRAYSYLRFSTPEQAKGDSYRRQTEAAVRYAIVNGLELDDTLTFKDQGVSGFRGDNVRKGALGQFLQAVDEGRVSSGSYLLVESLDRVSRLNAWDALPVFQQIINAGVVLVTLFDGKKYSREDMRANPLKILESLFVMVRAHEESETKSRRGKAVWHVKRLRAHAVPLTAVVPYWLKLRNGKIQVIPNKVAIIRRIVDMTLAGRGRNYITKVLNEEGVPPFRKRPPGMQLWSSSYISKIIRSPALIGTLVPTETTFDAIGKRVRVPLAPVHNYYPAIISEDQWSRLEALNAAGRGLKKGHRISLKNILAGLGRCPICASLIERRAFGKLGINPRLICSAARAGGPCPKISMSVEHLERDIRSNISYLVKSMPAPDPKTGERLEEAKTALREIGERKQRLVSAIAAGGADKSLVTALADLRTEEAKCEARLTQINQSFSPTYFSSMEKRCHELLDAATSDVETLNSELPPVSTGQSA